MRVLLVSANREKLPAPVVPLGVLSVAGALRAASGEEPGHEVEVVDLCFEDDPLSALRASIEAFGPDVVGIGLRNLHTNAYDGTEGLLGYYEGVVAEARRSTRAPIVLGGSAYSLQPEGLLGRLGADYGVVGEGEIGFRAMVDAMARGEAPPRIVRGEAAVAPRRPIILSRLRKDPFGSDLDLLPPPARDLIDPRYYAADGTDNLQTKRGCAFTCAYCDYPDLEGRKVRTRAPEAVADEVLARSRAPGVEYMFFVDSVFNVPRSHALAICRALIERGSPLPWACYGSPAAFDDEVVSAMAKAGCEGVEIGSDTGTERMLTRLRKPFTLADIRRTRELFLRYGISDCHTFVLGAEGETADEVKETLDFVDRLDPDVAVFIVFMEDREAMTVHTARHREAILRLLSDEAPRRAGWVVPELQIRFGDRLFSMLRRRRVRPGPAWLQLARERRPLSSSLWQRGSSSSSSSVSLPG